MITDYQNIFVGNGRCETCGLIHTWNEECGSYYERSSSLEPARGIQGERSWIEEIEDLRGALKLTQKEFAAKIEVSIQYFNDVVHGRRKPTPALTEKICDVFGQVPRRRRELHWAGARAWGWTI